MTGWTDEARAASAAARKQNGGNKNPMPIPGHPYHMKSDDELRYIQKDAHEAAQATRGMSSYDPSSGRRQDTEGKYLDQVNDASTVLGYRARGGQRVMSDDAKAAQALSAGSNKSGAVPVHSGASGRSDVNEHGHAWGSPEARADFQRSYGGPRDHAAEARGFRSGQREINKLRRQGK